MVELHRSQSARDAAFIRLVIAAQEKYYGDATGLHLAMITIIRDYKSETK